MDHEHRIATAHDLDFALLRFFQMSRRLSLDGLVDHSEASLAAAEDLSMGQARRSQHHMRSDRADGAYDWPVRCKVGAIGRRDASTLPGVTARRLMESEVRLQHGDRALDASDVRVRAFGHELPLTLRVEDAARLVGIGRSSMYAAVKRGEFSTMRINGRTVVLTVPLLRRMGLDVGGVGSGDPALTSRAKAAS